MAPHEATLRGTIEAFDAELLDAVICAWIAQQAGSKPADAQRSAIAVDGKVRGAWRPDGSQVHLLCAISHDTAVVLYVTPVLLSRLVRCDVGSAERVLELRPC